MVHNEHLGNRWNSGLTAIKFCDRVGADRAILVGFDGGLTQGDKRHFFGDHLKGMHNATNCENWPRQARELQNEELEEVEVINASRATLLDAWPRMALEDALRLPKRKHIYHVVGMHGLGDNIMQRACIKSLDGEVYLETPWPQIYQDMPNVYPVRVNNTLRTQSKNVRSNAGLFCTTLPKTERPRKVGYTYDKVIEHGSFIKAMTTAFETTNRDFSMPVPDRWKEKARKRVNTDKPILFYRPLTIRQEWNATTRNPDREHYKSLLDAIREDYFLVSVADIDPPLERIDSIPVEADLEFHQGELGVEDMVGLMGISSLVYCSPGFALVMAQATNTKMVCVFGGHESARLYERGAKTDCLISPINPCECFSKTHNCDKRIDMTAAIQKARSFIHEA